MEIINNSSKYSTLSELNEGDNIIIREIKLKDSIKNRLSSITIYKNEKFIINKITKNGIILINRENMNKIFLGKNVGKKIIVEKIEF